MVTRRPRANRNGASTAQEIQAGFRFTPGSDEPGFFEGVAMLMLPGANFLENLGKSRFTRKESEAAMALFQRGLKRLTNKEKEALHKGELSIAEAPYPMQIAELASIGHMSVGGLSRTQITNAITGIMTAEPAEDQEDRDLKDQKEPGQAA